MALTVRETLLTELDQIESDLQVSELSGDDDPSDDGIIARLGRAIDAWAARRAEVAEDWRRKNLPGYKPQPPPPVPSEILKRTMPRITDALNKAKSLPDLSRAAARDLSKIGLRWSVSLVTEALPYLVALWFLSDFLQKRGI